MPHVEAWLDAAPPAVRRRAAAFALLAEALRAGPVVITARGTSMTPVIRSGAQICLRACTEVRLGDVVAARMGGALVVHRVVGIDGDGRVLLKGDACAAPDGWLARDAVVGIVPALSPARPRQPNAAW